MPILRLKTRPCLPLALVLFALVALLPVNARADRYSDAVAHAGRPAVDVQRDETDHPAEVLRLSGIRAPMVVADFLAADGYYSELLSYLVGPKGRVYLLNNDAYDKWSERQWEGRVERLPNVTHQTVAVEHLGLPAHSLDAILLIKVYHDLYWHPDQGPWPKDIDADAVLTEIARVLKRGGILLLVDHSAKAGTGSADAGTLHRIDEATVKKEVEAAGFKLVGESSVLRNPADDRTAKVFDAAIRGKTDQFVLKFRKPAH